MTVREAEKILTKHFCVDGSEYCSQQEHLKAHACKGFLECNELYKPLVAALEKIKGPGCYCGSDVCDTCEATKALAEHRTHILGEESK